MDEYQRGIGLADVAPVFAAYEAFLRDALPRAEALQAARPTPLAPPGPFPVEAQEALCKRLSAAAGLDLAHAPARPLGRIRSAAARPTTSASPPATTRRTSPGR